MTLSEPDDRSFRHLMRRVPACVVLITARSADETRGMTASSFCGLSLDPLLVSFNVSIGSHMHRVLDGAQTFGVSVFSKLQTELADRFARADLEERDQFEGVDLELTADGTPLLTDGPGSLWCRTVQRLTAGDHEIFVGEVLGIREARDTVDALVYHERGYVSLGGPISSAGVADTPRASTPTPKNA